MRAPQQVEFFYSIHNASLSRSKASQYRSAIFYEGEDQKAVAEVRRFPSLAHPVCLQQFCSRTVSMRAQAQTAAAQQRFPSAIATEITPSSEFWRAEEYHQKYYDKNGGSCH
jgi:peptide-methionine (S)-S-oxide reductase